MVLEEQLPREFARPANGAISSISKGPHSRSQDWGVLYSILIRVWLGGNQPNLKHMLIDAESEKAECISLVIGNLLRGNTQISCIALWMEI